MFSTKDNARQSKQSPRVGLSFASLIFFPKETFLTSDFEKKLQTEQ